MSLSSLDAAKAFFAESLLETFQPYKATIESAIQTALLRFGKKTELYDACVYALQSGGKRFRPALTLIIAEALGTKDAKDAAVATEFFHTASLIADDLPCMDNDDIRRGRPTVHKAFNEPTALLASFALIAAGFEAIAVNSEKTGAETSAKISTLATYHAARLNGITGLIGGQYLDLNEKQLNREKIYEIMERKTATLFELSFILGWLFGGGDSKNLSHVQKAAFHFGVAFQILDDLDDMEKDQAANRAANFANLFGQEEAVFSVLNHLEQCKETLAILKIHSEPLLRLFQGMSLLASAF